MKSNQKVKGYLYSITSIPRNRVITEEQENALYALFSTHTFHSLMNFIKNHSAGQTFCVEDTIYAPLKTLTVEEVTYIAITGDYRVIRPLRDEIAYSVMDFLKERGVSAEITNECAHFIDQKFRYASTDLVNSISRILDTFSTDTVSKETEVKRVSTAIVNKTILTGVPTTDV